MSPLTTIQQVDFSKSEQYTLSIRINTDGFSFSIFNPSAENPYIFFDLPIDTKLPLIANFKNLVAHNPFLSQLYKRVNIIIANTRTVVHPAAYFEEEQKELLYEFSQKTSHPNIYIDYNLLEHKKIVVIFGVNKTLYHFLSEHFNQPRFFAQDTPLLAYFAQKSKEGTSKKLFVHLENKNLHVFSFNKGKLQLTNTFKAEEVGNQIYYILYIWKQMGYSQKEDQLILSGQVTDKDTLVELIRKYILAVSIEQSPQYLDLKAMNLCEL